MNSELSNLVWEQKFRPKIVKDTILPDTTKKMIQDIIASGNIPNFLFSGTSGVGKTTLARAIAEELGADLLFINASLESGIDTLRTTIAQFVSTVSFTDSKKIVLLDEADYLNPQSVMPALRGFLDEFSSNAIFILTCNFPSRIISPLLSRLTVVDFKFSKSEKNDATIQMVKRCFTILDSEGVKYDKKAVASVVQKNFPDFRKTLVELQRYSTSGEIDSGIVSVSQDSNMEELFTAIKGKDFTKCRQWISNNSMDAAAFYRSLYDKMLTELVPQTVPQIILHINDFQYQATSSIDPEINQIAFIISVMRDAQFK
jgi:DNA polymerase III delta prime subunit